jgi:hypothetical protein
MLVAFGNPVCTCAQICAMVAGALGVLWRVRRTAPPAELLLSPAALLPRLPAASPFLRCMLRDSQLGLPSVALPDMSMP